MVIHNQRYLESHECERSEPGVIYIHSAYYKLDIILPVVFQNY